MELPQKNTTKMSSRSRTLSVNLDVVMANDPLRELFEACKTGDIIKVKKLINSQTVNARDTAGRKSTPLHFASGMKLFVFFAIYLLLFCCCWMSCYRFNELNSCDVITFHK